ncbi:MAG TPA: AHH domain-containing protein [Bacillota bacterium]|nr:AHH domain-containing protein [Bacillota bacterium]
MIYDKENKNDSPYVSVNALYKPQKYRGLSVAPPAAKIQPKADADYPAQPPVEPGITPAEKQVPNTTAVTPQPNEVNPMDNSNGAKTDLAPESKTAPIPETRAGTNSEAAGEKDVENRETTVPKLEPQADKPATPDSGEKSALMAFPEESAGEKDQLKSKVLPKAEVRLKAEAPLKTEKVVIEAETPGQILGQLQNMPPTKAVAAYEPAQEASNAALENERKEAQQSLPEIPAPTGLTGPEGASSKDKQQAVYLKRKPLAAFKNDQSGQKGKEYQVQSRMAPERTVKPTYLRGGDKGDATTDAELSKNAQNTLENIRLDTQGVSASAGERPGVDVSGEADPSQLNSFQTESGANVQQAKAEAAQQINHDFGENDIFPETKAEKIKSKRTLSAPKKIAAAQGDGELPLDAETAAGLNKSLGPTLSKRLGEQKAQYDDGKEKYDQDSAQARADADRQVVELNRETRKQQLEEQGKAKLEVSKYRKEWKAELDKVDKDYQDKASKAAADQRKKIDTEKRTGEEKAARHLADAERKAEAEKQKAEQEAEQKKKEAKKDSGGFWGWLKSAATALIDGLKAAVNFIFDNLRKVVKGIFEAAKALVKGVIELARMAIVGLIKAYSFILKGLVSVVFAAFPDIAKKINAKIDQAVNAAVKAVNKAADMLKKGVEAVFDFLANTIDSLLGLVQSVFNGLFTVIGMIIRGEFAELMKRLGYLVTAAKGMPDKFETAAYEELLGGDLDKPLSPAELAQAGITPPGFKGEGGSQTGEAGTLPGPPWSTGNVGVDRVENNMELSPELTGELLLAGDKGEIEFGQSEEKDRTMAAVMSEATGEKTSSEQTVGEPTQEKYPDDGLTPRQRAEVKWTLMKQSLAAWWEQNKVTIIAGAIAAILGVIALIIVTGGAILAAIPPIMSVLGPLFIGLTVATIAGHVRDYVSKSWNEDTQGGAKSLAKALAAGAVELITWLTFKAGGAAMKGVKALAKGGVKLAKGTVKLLARGAKFIIEKGKILFKGIAGSGLGKRLSSLRELGKNLLERLRFKKFRIRFESGWFKLEGFINPWVLLATGEIREVSFEGEGIGKGIGKGGKKIGEKVVVDDIEGIVIGVKRDKKFVQELLEANKAKSGVKSQKLEELYEDWNKLDEKKLAKVLENQKSTYELGKTIELPKGVTEAQVKGWPRHHLIPEGIYKGKVKQFLDEIGFKMQYGKRNGMRLPPDESLRFGPYKKTSIHTGSHGKYSDRVGETLDRFSNAYSANIKRGMPKEEAIEKVNKALDEYLENLKKDIMDGAILLD